MESGANSVVGLLGLWMWLQLVAFLALLLGGMYALYCLGKAAAGLDRLAAAVEDLVARQGGPVKPVVPGVPVPPGQRIAAPSSVPVPPVMPAPAAVQPQPFTPGQSVGTANPAYPQEVTHEPTV